MTMTVKQRRTLRNQMAAERRLQKIQSATKEAEERKLFELEQSYDGLIGKPSCRDDLVSSTHRRRYNGQLEQHDKQEQQQRPARETYADNLKVDVIPKPSSRYVQRPVTNFSRFRQKFMKDIQTAEKVTITNETLLRLQVR